MDWRERIGIKPDICHGMPCIRGTRVMVSVILDNLAEGESEESIVEGYRLTREDIQAAPAFAVDLAAERPRPSGSRGDRWPPLDRGRVAHPDPPSSRR